MRLSCKVIEDILPMYYDGVCSEESAALVEEHLKECPHCSHILSELRSDITIPEKNVDDIKPLKKIQKSYKKMRMNWMIAIAVILVLIPVAFFAWNEYSGQGVTLSNLDELACANSFMSTLTKGDYEQAFSYWDVEAKKQEWLENHDFKTEDLVNFETDALKKFCELGEDKVESRGGIESFEYIGIATSYWNDYPDSKVYQIDFRVKFDGKDQRFHVYVSQNGVCRLGGEEGFIKDPLEQFCMWSEWLWQDYQGCYWDFDLQQYVYYDKEQ